MFINKNVEGERERGVCATALAEDASLSGKKGQKGWLLPSFIFWILQIVPSNKLEDFIEPDDWQ